MFCQKRFASWESRVKLLDLSSTMFCHSGPFNGLPLPITVHREANNLTHKTMRQPFIAISHKRFV